MKRILKLTTVYILILTLAASGLAFAAEAGETATTETPAEQQDSTAIDTPATSDTPAAPEEPSTSDTPAAPEEPVKPEEPKQEQESEEPAFRTSIKNHTIALDNYFTAADGTDKTPEITGIYRLDKSGRKVRPLSEGDYTIEIYRCTYVSDSENEFNDEIELVEACIKPGEYRIVATGQGRFKGTCEVLFTLHGIPQQITLEKTKYTKTIKSKDFTLNPVTDGDGSGFRFSCGNPNVATVSPEGVVTITGCGETIITVATEGDVLSHPSKQMITLRVAPAKVSWKAKNAAVRINGGTGASLKFAEAAGAEKYQIAYSTSKSFKSSLTRTKKTKKTSTTLKELKPGKKYYVRVRAVYEYTDSRGYDRVLYGSWSEVKNIGK
ncbi:MAG: fibronectin type III domain-containing protein [Firmicutes bacterium]|nr:fibronectin type III domain-containing protein [Bacillota bacterium]